MSVEPQFNFARLLWLYYFPRYLPCCDEAINEFSEVREGTSYSESRGPLQTTITLSTTGTICSIEFNNLVYLPYAKIMTEDGRCQTQCRLYFHVFCCKRKCSLAATDTSVVVPSIIVRLMWNGVNRSATRSSMVYQLRIAPVGTVFMLVTCLVCDETTIGEN